MEVNSTFYGQPRANVTAGWAARTPARFEFSLKLYQKFTHPEMFRDAALKSAPGSGGSPLDVLAMVTESDIDDFKTGIDPIAQAGKLGAKWWRHDKSEDRYNYLYSAEELKELTETAGAAQALVKKVRLYTNNHFAAKSVVNAVMLKAQLGEPIEGEYPRALVERYPEIRDLVATPRAGLRASP